MGVRVAYTSRRRVGKCKGVAPFRARVLARLRSPPVRRRCRALRVALRALAMLKHGSVWVRGAQSGGPVKRRCLTGLLPPFGGAPVIRP